MPQHAERLDIGLFQRRWSGRLALKHKVFPPLYLNELCICIVMCRSYFRAQEEEKMRFSDQIDPGSGALRNWQAQFERLLFDQRARRHSGAGSALSLGECRSAPRSRWRVWLSLAAELFRRQGCCSARAPCRTLTPHSVHNGATNRDSLAQGAFLHTRVFRHRSPIGPFTRAGIRLLQVGLNGINVPWKATDIPICLGLCQPVSHHISVFTFLVSLPAQSAKLRAQQSCWKQQLL